MMASSLTHMLVGGASECPSPSANWRTAHRSLSILLLITETAWSICLLERKRRSTPPRPAH